jgi:FkbM family methyltransferase
MKTEAVPHSGFSFANVVRRLIPLSLRNKFNSYLWKRLNLNWWLPVSGIYIRVTNLADWTIYNEIFVSGEYDAPIKEALSSAGIKLNVLDIGANVGFFSFRFIDLLRQSGRNIPFHITLIEGSPNVARELEERIEINLLSDLKVVNGLVGKRQGSARIAELDFHAQNTIMGRGGSIVNFVDLETILNAEPIDFLKCDIEGAELLFLENYPELLKRTRLAVFELHPSKCDLERCISILKESGFNGHKILRDDRETSVHQFWRLP